MKTTPMTTKREDNNNEDNSNKDNDGNNNEHHDKQDNNKDNGKEDNNKDNDNKDNNNNNNDNKLNKIKDNNDDRGATQILAQTRKGEKTPGKDLTKARKRLSRQNSTKKCVYPRTNI